MCESHRFEMVEHEPARSMFNYNLIQCSDCGSVVGAVETHNIAHLLYKMAGRIGVKL
jgi:hypothetical protein